MKQTPATAQISPLPELYKAHAPAFLCPDGAKSIYKSEIRSHDLREVVVEMRGFTGAQAEERAIEITKRCNNHTRLVEMLRYASKWTLALDQNEGFKTEVKEFLASLEQA